MTAGLTNGCQIWGIVASAKLIANCRTEANNSASEGSNAVSAKVTLKWVTYSGSNAMLPN